MENNQNIQLPYKGMIGIDKKNNVITNVNLSCDVHRMQRE